MLSEPLVGRPRASPWFAGFVAVLVAIGLVTSWRSSLPKAQPVELLQEKDLDAVRKMFAYVVQGKLQQHCIQAAQHVAQADVVWDASSDAMPHVKGARVYHGLQGFCDFFAFIQTFRQPDYSLLEMLHSGTGTVIVKESLTPTVIATNKTAAHAMQNLVEYKVRDGKLASMKVYWGEPATFDALFVK